MALNPLHPIYIPSKSRAAFAMTPRVLDRIGVPYRLVVEQQQWSDYREHFPASKLLALDPSYQETYDTFDELGGTKPRGPGPARNFIWDHSIAEGAAWHWAMDDNINYFSRLHRNERIPVADGTIFHAMEDFAGRYTNVAMAGPHYRFFAQSRYKWPPFALNKRIYSCNLIRNDLPFRWRGRYNEDTDLSLRILKAGWVTVQFYAFLQDKAPTQTSPGGNTEAFYDVEGTLAKSQMLARMHPDVARLARRYNRWHHYVDYRPFKGNRLIRRPGYEPPAENPYQFKKVPDPGRWTCLPPGARKSQAARPRRPPVTAARRHAATPAPRPRSGPRRAAPTPEAPPAATSPASITGVSNPAHHTGLSGSGRAGRSVSQQPELH